MLRPNLARSKRLRGQRPSLSPNESAPPDSFQDSDLRSVLTQAKHFYLNRIIQPDLPLTLRSSFLLQIHRERLVDRKASRKELRQTRKYLSVGRPRVLSTVRATCNR